MICIVLGIFILDIGGFWWMPFPRSIVPLEVGAPPISGTITRTLYYLLWLLWMIPTQRNIRNAYPVGIRSLLQKAPAAWFLVLRLLCDGVVLLFARLPFITEQWTLVLVIAMDILFSGSLIWSFADRTHTAKNKKFPALIAYAGIFALGCGLMLTVSQMEADVLQKYVSPYSDGFFLETALYRQMIYLGSYVLIDLVCAFALRPQRQRFPKKARVHARAGLRGVLLLYALLFAVLLKPAFLPLEAIGMTAGHDFLESDEISGKRYYYERTVTSFYRNDLAGAADEAYSYCSPYSLIVDDRVLARVKVMGNPRYHSCMIDGKETIYFGAEAILIPDDTGYTVILSKDINKRTQPDDTLSGFLMAKLQEGELAWLEKSYLYCASFLWDETQALFCRYAQGEYTEAERKNSEGIRLLYVTELARRVTGDRF